MSKNILKMKLKIQCVDLQLFKVLACFTNLYSSYPNTPEIKFVYLYGTFIDIKSFYLKSYTN